jgi:hypothetical protein
MVWAAESYRVKVLMLQSLGEGPNYDAYNGGAVVAEGTNTDWTALGLTEAAWLALVAPVTVWNAIDVSGSPVVFNGVPANYEWLLTRFPRYIRLRETGGLALTKTISIYGTVQ